MKILPDLVAGGGDFCMAGAVRFEFAETYRYFSGYGELELPGVGVFHGIGAQALLTPLQSQMGSGAAGVQITLSGLEPSVAAAVTGQSYREKPATIWRCQFDAGGVTLLGFQKWFVGRVGPIEETETVGGLVTLEIPIEGNALDMNRAGARMRSNADQKLLGGTADTSMRRVAFAGQLELNWGAAPAGTAAQSIPSVRDFNGIERLLLF